MANPIIVTYTPQTTGNHRICYKQTDPINDPSYCCMIDTTVSTPGVPKMYTITDVGVTVCDSGGPVSPVGEDPDTYTYNGYVQPVCAPDDGVTLATVWAAPVDFIVAAP